MLDNSFYTVLYVFTTRKVATRFIKLSSCDDIRADIEPSVFFPASKYRSFVSRFRQEAFWKVLSTAR